MSVFPFRETVFETLLMDRVPPDWTTKSLLMDVIVSRSVLVSTRAKVPPSCTVTKPLMLPRVVALPSWNVPFLMTQLASPAVSS
ncbi:hypothetical protein KHHGKMAE_3848 [Methylobacterium persicinum]|nr:hypothetical protein KHHGKMAE_3848 [Methylobacterium persicinum]